MRRFTLVLALLVAVGMTASAATHKRFETITVADTAIGITSTIHTPLGIPQMKVCQLRVEGAEIRIRWDGTAPTSAVGIPVEVLEIVKLESHADITQLRMIRTTGTSATVSVMCWTD
jgi:hypothetical protein